MKEKIVVLNSGGFDSVVLLHDVVYDNETSEVHSLHFTYGELNRKSQNKYVDKVCKKLGVVNKKITIPKINWSSNKFYDKGVLEFNSQYLEYRNLIFLSYAVSYAQSIGANKIYLAVLKSHGYCDTSKEFIEGLNQSIKESGITIFAPYSDLEKNNLWCRANLFGIKDGDFVSCDCKKPCGVCGDCNEIKAYLEYLSVNSPEKAFNKVNTVDDPFFKHLFRETKLEEVRLLINNECQLRCEHCFYGFDDMKSNRLSFEDMCKVIKEAIDIGVESFHFSGKEPMIDETIFKYAEYIRSLDDTILYDVVTNGITIPKYKDKLIESGFKRVCLSVDDVLNSNGVRSVSGVTDKALTALKDTGIITEVFIDLHENNCSKVVDIIEYLHSNYSVNRFFVRTIRNIGNADVQLSILELDSLFNSLMDYCEVNSDIHVSFNIGSEYVSDLYEDEGTDLYAFLKVFVQEANCYNILRNLTLIPEFYCNRYYNQITVTPDGYVLGCGAEVSSPDYDKLSVGNVRENSLKHLFMKGKDSSIELQCKKCITDGKYSLKSCPFSSNH